MTWSSALEFSVHSEPRGEWAVVRVRGETDAYTAPMLRARLTELIDNGHHRVVVDLGDTPFVDASGLGVLVAALKRARAHGGTLRVVAPRRLARLFELAHLQRVLPPWPSVEAATACGDDDRWREVG